MTSVVDTSVKFFHSKMPGAPVLRGQAGSLISILDACLVNGWGLQTASSVVVASGVCTMTFPLDHAALVDCVVLVAGSSIAALNGEQKVTFAGPNTLKFATAAANGTATGTITAKMAPLGFTKPFSGTNLAVYKSGHVQANGQFLRVNDTGAADARVVGYETMTAISTGTGLFPTAVQLNGGLYAGKSYFAGTIPIDWTLVGDGRFFALFSATFMAGDVSYTNYVVPTMFAFGDPVNLGRAADPFSTILIADAVPTPTTTGVIYFVGDGSNSYRYMPRDISGTGTAVSANVRPMGPIYPVDPVYDRITGQVMLSKLVIHTNTQASWRAEMPGMYLGPAQYMEQAFTSQAVFKAGTPERSFLSLLVSGSTNSLTPLQLLAIDVTGPWR